MQQQKRKKVLVKASKQDQRLSAKLEEQYQVLDWPTESLIHLQKHLKLKQKAKARF